MEQKGQKEEEEEREEIEGCAVDIDDDDMRYLIIANVSKKPNMKTLIYSAAAHGFSVVIVGLPNLDVADLHLAEGVVEEESNVDKRNWRNNNHAGSSGDIDHIGNGDHVDSSGSNNENSSDNNDNINNVSINNDHISIDDNDNNTTNNDSIRKNDINQKYQENQKNTTKKVKKIKILRFETLTELKIFLVARRVALMGIEIMDEGEKFSLLFISFLMLELMCPC